MIKKIIHKIDKIIQPKKYYTNNITKKIIKLNVGDKLYALSIPNMEKLSVPKSLTALDDIKLTTVSINYIQKVESTTIIQFIIKFENKDECMISRLSYMTERNNSACYLPVTLNVKRDVNDYSFNIRDYWENIIFTTDKNIIIEYIKTIANTVKCRLLANTQYNEEHKQQNYLWTMHDNKTEYGNYYIIRFKQQYAKIIHKLLLM